MSYGFDETYDVYDETHRRARKDHRCDACGEVIPPKAVYTRVFILYDGKGRSLKRCLRCQGIHEHLRTLCRDAIQMWPDERLNCGQRYEDEWGECPPEVQAMAFVLPGDKKEMAR